MGADLTNGSPQRAPWLARGGAVVVAALLVVAVLWTVATVRLSVTRSSRPLPFRGSVVSSAPAAPDLALSDAGGRRLRLDALRGDSVLVVPTAECPPRCLDSSPQMRLVNDLLGPWGVHVTIVEAALAGRSNLAAAQRALPRIHRFLAADQPRSTLHALAAAARGVAGLSRAQERAAYLVDPNGRLRVVFTDGLTMVSAPNVAHDLGVMVGEVFPGEPGGGVCL